MMFSALDQEPSVAKLLAGGMGGTLIGVVTSDPWKALGSAFFSTAALVVVSAIVAMVKDGTLRKIHSLVMENRELREVNVGLEDELTDLRQELELSRAAKDSRPEGHVDVGLNS